MRALHPENLRSAGASANLWSLIAASALLNQWLAVVALLALTVSPIIGTLAAAAFIGVAMACLALRPAEIGATMLRFWPVFLLPVLALTSTLWSDAPERTLRAGIQLMVTYLAAIAVCRRLDASTMILVLFGGFFVVDMYALTFVPRSLASGMPLVGPFGSKNALGFTAVMQLALALAVLFDAGLRWLWRLAALSSLPLALGLIVLAQSAGALTSAGIMVTLFLILALLVRVPRPARIGLVALAAVLAGIGALFSSTIMEAANDFRQDVLHKDATLTGRTHLWDYAEGLSRQDPLLGHGYYAFWRQGNVEAEGLWRWGGIAARAGFNFHNAVIETRVDLGLIGMIVLVGTCAWLLGYALYRHICSPSVPLAFFVALTVVLYIRSYAESGMISPFSLPTVLLVATLIYAGARRTETALVVRPGSRGQPRVTRTRFAAGRR